MKCLDDCHTYQMETFLGETKIGIHDAKPVIHFHEMRPDGTKIDGVTNEEVLKVLIHRLHFLNETWQDGKFGCVWNDLAIKYLEEALEVLNVRTKDRESRKVEGTQNP